MNIVGHPAPAEQRDVAGRKVRLLVAAPVFFGQEDVLAVVAAMGDVLRTPTATTRPWRGI